MRDLYYVEDLKGVVLLVKGDHHPPQRVRCYPVFWPQEDGERARDGRSYTKLTSDCDNERYLESRPECRDEDMPTVPLLPKEEVVRVWRPREGDTAGLEGRWRALHRLLGGVAGAGNVGLLGSALVGLDRRPDGSSVKDVDFVVYGRRARDALRAEIETVRAELGAGPISKEHVRYHAAKFGAFFAPGLTSWDLTLERKWSSLQLEEGLLATVRFCYLPGEEPEDALAEPVLEPDAVVSGVVVSDDDVDFMPRRFVVSDEESETFAVSSYFWGHQSCVSRGDRVVVTADRRRGGLTLTRLSHGVRILES